MIRKRTFQCLLLVSTLILLLALPLIIGVTEIPAASDPNVSSIISKSFNHMDLVRLGTVYTSTDSVKYVRRGYVDSDANHELIVYSNESASYKVTVVDGKTSWSSGASKM
ncbi:MAG: hypothetical protein KIH08_16050 [Candidatus Freyarchaeota archaeon]|nr:hypothetical protein [Candidatus Jordarchaeia archaeon]MBS7269766.1 hypothetical protein [Candidatus Jordarchaeia archaeon]MBS7280345.1 hypothetical protein [Candidatus Jordarchaeia archaeon]